MTKKLKAKKHLRPYTILSEAVENGLKYGVGCRLFKHREYPATHEAWMKIEDAVINDLRDYVMAEISEVADLD